MSEERFLVVTAEGRCRTVPTGGSFAVGLEEHAATPGTALRQVSARATTVIEAARSAGVGDPEIMTGGLGVQPRYDNRGERVIGFQADYTLTISVDDVDRVGPLVDAVADAAGDALRLHGLSTRIVDPDAARTEALANAVRAAHDKAGAAAGAAGLRLGRVMSITEGVREAHQPYERFAMAAAVNAGGGTPVEAGTAVVTATVTVRFALEDTD
ncbi:MAG: SIMPL domain-containing protein [Nocardioidaceae bacterium]